MLYLCAGDKNIEINEALEILTKLTQIRLNSKIATVSVKPRENLMFRFIVLFWLFNIVIL